MFLVRLALRRPYTFVVMALLILILGSLAIVSTPTDIFPNIDIPVLSVIWSYAGLPADEMSGRLAPFWTASAIAERAISARVPATILP